MDILHGTSHGALPQLRHVAWNRPFHWLGAGLADLVHTPSASIGVGALFTLVGLAMFANLAERPQFLLAATAGFLLVAPCLAVIFYELSRRRERGESPHLQDALQSLLAHWRPLALYGVLLSFIFFCWERLTTALVAYLLADPWIWSFQELVREIFLSPRHPYLSMVWIVSGGLLAACTFLISVVTAPMILDRGVGVEQGMAASIAAVTENVPAMLVWSLTIVVLTLLGFVTFMLGLAITMPLLGHATWHAYKDLVE